MQWVFAEARRQGLQFNGGRQLIGHRDDVLVRVHLKADGSARRIAAEVPATGFEARLTNHDVPDSLRQEWGSMVPMLEQGWLVWAETVPERLLSDALDRVASQAQVAARWWRRPLLDLVDEFDLAASSDFTSYTGTVQGVEVSLREIYTDTGRWRGHVEGRVIAGLPTGVNIQPPGPGRPATHFDDLILDRKLSIRGPLPDLQQDDVRGALLAVVLDHRGTVTTEWVQALVPSLRHTDAVRRALRDVVDLVRGLAFDLDPW